MPWTAAISARLPLFGSVKNSSGINTINTTMFTICLILLNIPESIADTGNKGKMKVK